MPVSICSRAFVRALLVLGACIALMVSVVNVSHAQSQRSVATAHGDIAVPEHPKRVVTLYEAALDTSIAVGVKPLGAVYTRGGSSVADYIKDQAHGVDIVGGPRDVNFEKVLSERPDLILASPFTPDSVYQRLSQIAPTIVPKHDRQNPFPENYWQKESRLFAQALGKEQEINGVYAKLDKRIDQIGKAINPKRDQHLALVRWNPQGPIVMSERVFADDLLRRLGFIAPKISSQLTKRPHSDVLSLENLDQIDGDWLLLATLNGEGREALAAAEKQPAFQRLKVAQNKRVIAVDGSLWTSAAGPIAANQVLDQIEQKLKAAHP
ncbi:ABC transporter substrate-binding protein [Carnimonas bestiolae]|uniref:ABC transporter substrate-binding protein n=1 Tax=Carnimonas bestiolae TaxID=3402172 RepID=UPI003EDC4951